MLCVTVHVMTVNRELI